MASSAKQISIVLLLTLLSSLHAHARDSQFFNKVTSTTNENVVVPNYKQPLNNQQDPNFLPENENGYGLYGHESGQDPPSATTTAEPATTTTATTPQEFKQPTHKYLPKNYNPVAYVTQPEDINNHNTFTQETTNPAQNNYYNNNNQREQETEYRNYQANTNKRDRNSYYYNGGSSFNSGGAAGFQPQGLSDTRALENGKYFYDVNTEKYSSNHPYESLRGRNEFNNRNYHGNSENNAYEFNNENYSMGGYQNQEEFQDEENMP